MPSVDEFQSELRSLLREAESRSLPHLEINSGQLHRKLGGYPGTKAQMPSCCLAMYHEQKAGDEVISRPPKGKGASLTIRYQLPRSATSISEAPRREKLRVNVVAPRIRSGSEFIDRSPLHRTVAGYDFELICALKPLRNSDGNVQQVMPQSQYENSHGISLNNYGKGPFCKFQIPNQITVSGVYILTLDEQIRYVGECVNLSARYNAGYGNISPKNCFKGGHETNCRINNLVYSSATAGETILLWFFRTADYKKVEAELRVVLRPAWNRI